MSSPHSGALDRFLGNHTHTDFFKLLRQDGDSLVIGARNVIYNITIDGLAENRAQVSEPKLRLKLRRGQYVYSKHWREMK